MPQGLKIEASFCMMASLSHVSFWPALYAAAGTAERPEHRPVIVALL